MCVLKYFSLACLIFSFYQSPHLQASDNVHSKIELELTHSLLKTKIVKDNKLFCYRLHLASKQKLAEEEFKLIVINCSGQPTGHTKIWFDKEEKAWIYENGKKLPLEEFETTIGNFSDGEFVDLIIVDDKKQILTGTRICPKPIECQASDGAILSLLLHSPEGQYALRGFGFKPNETLTLVSQSEEEVMAPFTLEVSEEGMLTAGISPWVLGKPYGHASVILTRQDSTKMKLVYLWGTTEEKLATKDYKNKERKT
jgi:hypothetical protein